MIFFAKGPLCTMQEALLAKTEYKIHKYVFISVKLPVNINSCVLISLEKALYIYIRSRPSYTKPPRCAATVAQNGHSFYTTHFSIITNFHN